MLVDHFLLPYYYALNIVQLYLRGLVLTRQLVHALCEQKILVTFDMTFASLLYDLKLPW